MMGLHFMNEVPFRHVYLHALVRDAQGQKMSKSKGNVIDPLTIMEKYGTDAVRFTLSAFAAQGRDIKLAEERIEGYRHFINKIWNATRLVLLYCPRGEYGVAPSAAAGPPGVAEQWILSRLNWVIRTVRQALDRFDFDVVARELYQFFWHEYCDWYLEMAKPTLSGAELERQDSVRTVAVQVLDHALRLLHPIIPFVTEELWHNLPGTHGHIMVTSFPRPRADWDNPQAESEIHWLMDVVTGLRNVRAELGIHPGAQIQVLAHPHSPEAEERLTTKESSIATLAKVEELRCLGPGEPRPHGAASVILEDLELFIPLVGLVDIREELRKINKEEDKLRLELAKATAKLNNENFLSRAPTDVIAKEREKVKCFQARMEKLAAHRIRLEELTQ